MKLKRQLVVFCVLIAGLLFATAPHVLAHPAPNTRSNSAAANAANPPGNQGERPAHPPADNQANPPAGNQAGPPPHAQANASAASETNPPADRADADAERADANANRADANAHRADANADRTNLLADREHPRETSRATPAKAPARRADLQSSHSGPSGNSPSGNSPSGNSAGGVDPAQPGQGGGNQGQGGGGGATTDPAGNNGTVKVDMNGDTTTRNNEAQGDCQGITSKLFNFDGGEAITITFSGQAPTEFTTAATPMVIADADGNQSTSFSFGQIVPLGTASAPSGGYHVRIEADGQNHDAGPKTKVFWLRCDTFDLAGSEASAATATPGVQVRGVTIERGSGSRVAGRQEARVANPAAAGVNRALRARVLGASVENAALARTGLDAMQLVTLAGLALFAGYAALRVSRRNSEPTSSLIP